MLSGPRWMKPFRYWLPLSAARSQYSNTCLATELKSTEIAKFLCLRRRCLGACRKVNGVSFSSFVVPIYAAALANIPRGEVQGYLNFMQGFVHGEPGT